MVTSSRPTGAVSCAGIVIVYVYDPPATTTAGDTTSVVSLPTVVRKVPIGCRVTRTSSITCSGVVKRTVKSIGV